MADEADAPLQPDDGLYGLVPASEDSKQRVAPVKRPISPTAQPATRTLGYAQSPEAKAPNVVDAYFPDRVKDLHMPLVLIAGGTVVHVAYALIVGFRSTAGLMTVLSGLGKELILDTAMMLVAVLIAGRARHIDFGPLPVAALKLCAVAIAPDAAAILLMPIFLLLPFVGGLGVWLVSFCLYFALIGALFDLDQSDTWYCVCVMFLVKLGVFFAMMYLF